MRITKNFIEKAVLGCMAICKGSIEDTPEFLKSLFHFHISIGRISKIINELARRAKVFNDSISLKCIQVGAHDEIFQADQAVLVGVEPNSTYIYLCDGSKTRDSTVWGYSLLDKQVTGLNIELSVMMVEPDL
ncbi:hypothetical protein [Niameybacter sp.]|uniref:hypothetical protein n=1 Tax=Niameybacter sp. TaxID=2033640 RepID=UPI002FC9D3B2